MKPELTAAYAEFCEAVRQHGLTLAELRCDVPPSEVVLDLIDYTGPAYEWFVTKYATVEGSIADASKTNH